jgi:hypothetical protein
MQELMEDWLTSELYVPPKHSLHDEDDWAAISGE